ncbi:hypothetical protein [Rariglobus hedericola]|uniref:Uncharacterized protein n=1 Tax=Rariglobus hedericola TaxID=2597822 RepID=A0A556QMP6_9BACT|nr:hypothetical protein [Rariglobus hedericola]TSJ77903.1 hypothetical protein FPL22_00920 [Rariglobus hedericola]
MSPKVKNYLIILLAVATISSGLIAWSQSRRLTALQNELLKASAAAATVKPKPAPIAASFTAPATTTPAEIEPAANTEEAEARQRQRGGNNNRPNFAALMANPEFAQAMSVQQRAALDGRYADLFKKLNLSPAQLEKFKDLLIERQTARMDVMTAARESGLNARENRDELRKMTDEAQSEVDSSIKTALGETAFNQYQNYETTQSQRALVSQLDQRLSYSSTPLNSTQSDFLVSALATSSTASTNDQGGGGGPGNWGGGNRATISDAVIAQAKSVLTPDQVSALTQLQSEQKAQQQIRELMRANTSNAKGTTAGAAAATPAK